MAIIFLQKNHEYNIFVQKPLLQFTFMSQVLYDMIVRNREKLICVKALSIVFFHNVIKENLNDVLETRGVSKTVRAIFHGIFKFLLIYSKMDSYSRSLWSMRSASLSCRGTLAVSPECVY